MPETGALYTVDVDGLKHRDTLYASSFFKNVRTVMLEEHDDALIGEIQWIQAFDSYILIFDFVIAQKLLVFDKNGKFLRQIGKRGRGPGEYIQITDFCIDPERREIYLLDAGSRKVLKYSLDSGEYISSINLPKNDINPSLITYAYDRLYLKIKYYGQLAGNDNLLMEFDIKTGKYTDHISSKKWNLNWKPNIYGRYNFFSSQQPPLRYAELFMNTVFAIEKDSIYPYLTLKTENWPQKVTEEEYDRGLTKAYHIRNYFEYEDYIHLQYDYRLYRYTVVYNKTTNEAEIYDFSQNDLVFSKGHSIPEYYYVDYQTSKAYGFIHVFNFDAGKYELAPGLDRREELSELMKSDNERIVVFEYEFK
ncbi:MAG: 6-bladed beta-propeller [Prevotellaceae bacterium]|jgi:hypothetical protein|nr:6-bladed beta-propeller [Prevotellaceae bacterium]